MSRESAVHELTRTARLTVAAALAAVLLLYLTLPNKNYAYDALGYATDVQGPLRRELLHPHHLIFHVLAWAWHHMLQAFVTIEAIRSVQALNSLLAVAGLGILFKVLYAIQRNVPVALALTLVVASSFSYWYFAIECETYVAPMIAVIATTYVVLCHKVSIRSGVAAAVLTAIAVLFYQQHVLLVLPVAAYLYCAGGLRNRVMLPCAYVALAGLLTLVPYLVAAQLLGRLSSPASFVRWVTLYAHTIDSYGIKGWSNVPNSALGFSRVFFAFANAREAFLASNVQLETILLGMLTLAWLVVGLWLVWRERGAIRERLSANQHRCALVFCGVWLLTYSAFAMIVEPKNHEYWFPVLVPLVIVAAVLFPPNRRAAVAIALMAALGGVVNLVDFVYPSSSLERNTRYTLATKLRDHGVRGGDLVLINRSPVDAYYKYVFGETIALYSLADLRVPPNKARQALEESRNVILTTLGSGRRVLLSSNELSDPPRGTQGRGRLSGVEVSRFIDTLQVSRQELFAFDQDGSTYTMYELKVR
jgi:hypothetical protein